MKELKSSDEVRRYLEEYEKLKDTVLIIDGNTLHEALKINLAQYFFKVAGKVQFINSGSSCYML
jgi:GTP-binding protein EngB required for normal cell division